MSRQLNLLNLRVSDEFAERLEQLARRQGRTMASVLETVGGPALAAAEADADFENEAFEAYEAYELNGEHVTQADLGALFASAKVRAQAAVATIC